MNLMAKVFYKNAPKYGPQHKRCSLKYAVKFSRNVSETKQPGLRYHLYAGAFVNCT
jgi:hypothetical protein